MEEYQRQGVVAGFLHVLKHSPEVFEEWDKQDSHDADAIGKLVQKTMGLKEPPAPADLQAMAAHADTHLKPQLQELQAKSGGVPKTVGNFYASH